MSAKQLTVFTFYLSSILFAQSQTNIIRLKADSLFNCKNYFDAITEYKRYLYFTEDESKVYCFSRIGECYKAGAKFDNAIDFFSSAWQAAGSNEEKFAIKVDIIRCNILRKTTARAIEICNELENDARFNQRKEEINYWKGWALMMADEWEMASTCFGEIDPNHALKLICNEVVKEKVSVTFATVISYILPGAGQIYSGRFLSGLMSLAWNVSTGFLTINAFIEQRAFDGIVIGELLWLRFYRGNVQNAEHFAVEKNLKVSNDKLRFLQNEYIGLKP